MLHVELWWLMLTPKQTKDWTPLVKRLSKLAQTGGYSVITIHILTNETGKPVIWSEPNRARVEPKAGAAQIFEMWQERIDI